MSNVNLVIEKLISLVNNAPPMPDDYLRYSEKPHMERVIQWRLEYAKKIGDEIAVFVGKNHER